MAVTDLHAHLIVPTALTEMRTAYPDLAPDLVERDDGYFLHYPGRPPLGPVPASMFDVAARRKDMAAMRIERQVIALPPPQLFYHVPAPAGALFARLQNDSAIEISQQNPDIFDVFATLPLQDPAAAVKEINRIAGRPQVRGVQLGTNVAGTNLDSAELEPVWNALSAANLPVWVHPDQRAIAGADRLASYYLVNLIGNPLESTIAIACLIFGGVLERHPILRFGFVHGGGFAPYQTGRWDHGWGCRPEPQAAISQPPTTYFGRMYFDTLTHDRDALALLGQRVGWQQVVMGSDYPFDMASAQPVSGVEALQLAPADETAVLAGNAEAFLRPVAG